MREFTKSLNSFTWSISMFGVQQMLRILTPPSAARQMHPATEAFRSVTSCAEEELDDMLKGAFRAGDSLQRGMVDLMFGMLTLQMFNPAQWMGRGTPPTGRKRDGDGPESAAPCGWGPVK